MTILRDPGPITAVLFTWSWGGFCVRYQNGQAETLSPRALLGRVGRAEYDRLSKIAHSLAGHWHTVPATVPEPDDSPRCGHGYPDRGAECPLCGPM